jgi:alginate O-acetyltransferase complex protein AlgI
MLFNSYEFIFLFLPIALVVFWILSFFQRYSLVTIWLILVSLFFYFVWSPKFLLLLLVSIAFNWSIGELLARQRGDLLAQEKMTIGVKLVAILGVTLNLGMLGYFKYINFFIDNINGLGANLEYIDGLILPLGISFYTFEQISYLIGVASGRERNYSFPRLVLFVTFFPHLIAGPILSADELIPQFRRLNYRFDFRNLAIGLTIFAIGLFKKSTIADSFATYATPVFTTANNGELVSFFLAWQAAIAYTLQLYFDFSGYSDMAIGVSKMFNIKLPINFYSPYQAIGIGDFWRRWHISLGRFLRDYIYIPLGGSWKGEARCYTNLLITMLLGGFWHGASWTFIVWGALHGIYLCIDRAWKQFLKHQGLSFDAWYHSIAARLLTFLAVVVSWVIFRAETLSAAGRILTGMFGGSGFILPERLAGRFSTLSNFGVKFQTISNYSVQGILFLMFVLCCTLFLPNLYQLMLREPVALDVYGHLKGQKPAWYAWRPTVGYACCVAVIFVVALISCNQKSEFLYFQF